LSILNQQLSLNSTSLESVNVLIDDVTLALKNNNINNALIHLNLIKQQLTPNGISPTTLFESPQISNMQANHSPKVYNATVDVSYVTTTNLKLNGDDPDGNPVIYSIISNATHGQMSPLDQTTGVVNYNPRTGYVGNDSIMFQATDSHGAKSNIGQVSITVFAPEPISSSINPTAASEPNTASPETTIQSEDQSINGNDVDNRGNGNNGTEDDITNGVANSEQQQPITTEANPSSYTGINWSDKCQLVQSALYQSCDVLVNSDGSLTEQGQHAMHCIRNGALLGGGAKLLGIPTGAIISGLGMLARTTGCDGVVNMGALKEVGGIGSIMSILP
jgi:Bacterial Ig domain